MTSANVKDCRWCLENGLAGDVLRRNASHFVVGKAHSTNPAVLIIPLRHVETPFMLRTEEWADLGEMLSWSEAHLGASHPQGYTIGWNVGEAAGQHVFHAHLHVISRNEKDATAGRGLRDFIFER